jgi:hypothetical protein
MKVVVNECQQLVARRMSFLEIRPELLLILLLRLLGLRW